MSKRCSKCGEVKDLTEFHRNASTRDGLQRSCKPCQLAYLKSHYWRNRQYYLDKARRRNRLERALFKELIRSLKSVPCADCGGVFPPWVMTFDHVRGTKLFDVGRGFWGTRARILEEVAKCEMVCANCHADRTYRRFHARP
jgi:hypothetical protein